MSGALRVAALAATAVLAVACASSTPPPTKKQQRGMTENIGGVPQEEKFEEEAATLPAYPGDAGLIEFRTRRNSDNRFYIDRESLTIGKDRVVRYTVVVKSPSGASTVSYEGMRCKTAGFKVYAFGVEGKWREARDPEWRAIPALTPDLHFALYKDYLCDGEAIGARTADQLRAIVGGREPDTLNLRNR